jgi:acetoin utilization deacetylase AcuC-like enzyme
MALTSLPVFFRPEQVTPRDAVHTSPSSAKPEAVVASWRALGIPLDVRSFQPLSREALSRVHSPAYVDAVLDLETENGFGNRDARVATSLPYTSGSFVAAALHVLEHGGAAASPTSGFHHACHADGGGFCTFNGLAAAASEALARGCPKVGILDCDAHYGNGTQDILEETGLEDRVRHYTHGSPHYRGGPEKAGEFLAHLPKLLAQWKDEGVALVLYQAGADPHVEDPIGCQFLTTPQLHARDTAVFTACAQLGLPVAWNLAGGYQEDRSLPWPTSIRKVLDIHDNTLRACAAAFLQKA